MVTVRTVDLTIKLGEFHLENINLQIEAGEYFILLGPTGAGKTVLIECIAGMHQPQSGKVFLGEEDVTHKRLEERGIGYVPQDYALFPNMTVEDNIAFGLRVRRIPPDQTSKRVQELTDLLHIKPLLQRHPLTLSGGEKQRVALARALAVRPRLLLLDEPLAAVDENTRDRLCSELREIQRETGVTVIHVSHNFEETLMIADRVGILHNGRSVQCGTAEDVFRRPVSRFVAEFTRSENIFSIDSVEPSSGDGTAIVTADAGRVRIKVNLRGGKLPASPRYVVIRPELVKLAPDQSSSAITSTSNDIAGRVSKVTNKGALLRVEVASATGSHWVALVPRTLPPDRLPCEGQQVHFLIDPFDVHLM